MSRFNNGPFATFNQQGDQQRLHDQGKQVSLLSIKQQQQWLDLIASTHHDQRFPGTLLPRLTEDNVVYYALTQSEREWRKLSPFIKAFAGQTIVWEYSVTDKDPMDRELKKLQYHGINKFSIPKIGSQQQFENRKLLAIQAMKNLASSVMNAPSFSRKPPRPLSELLDRFELALNAGDLGECDDVIEELKDERHLDHMNIRFLRVRVFQRMGEWKRLREWRAFKRLCKARRPKRISTILIKAIYHTELAALGDDTDALIKQFKNSILPVCGNLFQELPEIVDDKILRTYAIHAVSTNDTQHWKVLVNASGQIGHKALANFLNICEGLLKVPSQPTHKPTKTKPSVATHNTKQEAITAIALAYAENCPDKASHAIELYEQLSKEEQREVLAGGKLSDMWHHLTTILSGGWDNCFEILRTSSDDASDMVLYDTFNEWPAQDQLSGTENSTSFLGKLESALSHETSGPRLISQLQALVNWAKEDSHFPRQEAVPIYITLLELFALSERITLQRLDSYSDLLDQVLTCGLDAEQYERGIEATLLLVDQTNATRSMNWLLELVEMLLDHNSPKPSLRETLLWNVLSKIKTLGVELAEWQKTSLKILFRSLQQFDDKILSELPVAQEESSLTLAAHKSIAIYTLEETAGKRVQEILEEVCPTARVSVSSDKSSNSGLKHLAKNVDIFIVAWRSAKHAATIDIKQNRPKTMPTLYPKGKGASSILRELETHLQSDD